MPVIKSQGRFPFFKRRNKMRMITLSQREAEKALSGDIKMIQKLTKRGWVVDLKGKSIRAKSHG